MKSKLGLAAWAATIVLLVGCSELEQKPATAADGGKFYVVTAESADFFRYGPQQGNGPDKKLEKGTLVTLIRPSFGTCKVKLLDGQQGFVANEDIGVASPALIAAATTAPAARPRNARFRFDSPDPRLVVPSEPLPWLEPTPIPDERSDR
jgi:hypothetical protein